MIPRAAALALLGPLLGLGAVAIPTHLRAQARVVSRPALPERSLPDTERLFSAGSQDSVPQAVLVELRIRGLASATVQAYRVRTEALLPLAQFLSLAQVRYHLSPDGVLEASVPPGPSRLVVAAGNDTMTFGDHRVRLEPEFRLFKDGELYVGAERLGNLLGSAIVVDWAGLTVTLMDAGPAGRPAACRHP